MSDGDSSAGLAVASRPHPVSGEILPPGTLRPAGHRAGANGAGGGKSDLTVESAIRTQRNRKGVSLRSLAKDLGISASQLSKIETGKSKISVDLALKIAGLLDVPAAVFLSKGAPSAMGRRTITRASSSEIQQTPGMRFRPLCSDFKDHEILYWIVDITATTFAENGGWREHPGQEFFYVLSGQVQLLTQLYEPTTLNEGDSILFDSDQPHAYICVDGPAKVAMINKLA